VFDQIDMAKIFNFGQKMVNFNIQTLKILYVPSLKAAEIKYSN
jgi:hypothetical protein